MTGPVIKLSNIVKTYRGFGLRIPEMALAEGKLHVLIGPNGAGKSTLLRLLIGLSLPDEGEVEVFGKSLNDNEAEIKLHIGYAAAEMDFPQGMRIKRCLDFVAGFYPQWSDEMRQRLVRAFEVNEKKTYYTLSPGQKMRVLVTAAFARMPNLILLDEPFASLDPLAKEKLKDEIVKFLRDGGNTVLMATNELADAERVIDELHVVRDGLIVASGTPIELCNELLRFSFIGSEDEVKLPAGFPGTAIFVGDRGFAVAKGDEGEIAEMLIKAGARDIKRDEVKTIDVMRYHFGSWSEE